MSRKWGLGDMIYDTDLESYFTGDLVTLGGTSLLAGEDAQGGYELTGGFTDRATG